MSQIRFTQHQLNCNLAFLTTFDLLKDKQNHQEVCNLAFLPITDVFIGIADYIMAITVFWSDGTVNLSNSTRPSNKQTQPNLNNSGLTWQSYEGHSSRNDSSTSNKRRCADILPTNLFKAFSISKNQGFQIYDISSEEEETNYEDHSDYETTTLPQEEISVQTVQDDERAQVLKMATIFQNIFQDKPMKKGWTKSKRPGKTFGIKSVL
ncbi:unnamed protein product [Brassica oleracea var. botrytis]